MLIPFPSDVQSMYLLDDHGPVAVGLGDGTIELFDLATGARLSRWHGHERGVRALCFTTDGVLVSAALNGTVTRWRRDGTAVWSRDAGIGEVLGVCGVADGRVVVCGDDGSVLVLDAATGLEVVACRGHTAQVNAVVSLGDGHRARLLRGPTTGPSGSGRAVAQRCGWWRLGMLSSPFRSPPAAFLWLLGVGTGP